MIQSKLTPSRTNIFRGALLDTRDTKGRTALGLAVINGHLPVVSALLRTYEHPLMLLQVKVLLEAGSDSQIRDAQNSTCLDYALSHDRHDIVDCLLTFDPANIKKYARKNKHIGQSTKTWIDAICINQHDLQEKNEQVSVMDRIYSQATFVTIWLGRDDGTGSFVSDTICKLFNLAGKMEHQGDIDFEPYKSMDPSTCQQMGLPYISDVEWLSLAALYLRQQFRRLWCLQEAVLREDVVMYLGEHHVPWDEFMMVTEKLHIWQRKYAVPPSSRFRPFYTAAIESEAHLISELRMRRMLDHNTDKKRKQWFQHTKRFWRGEGQKCQIPLLEMVLSTITFECSDPRDHIYALVGLCKDHPESPAIKIDYAKPWEEVYTDVMRACLNSERESSLKVVAFIRDSANYNNENLPSWVLHFGQAGISPFWQLHKAAAGEYSASWNKTRGSSGRENELVLEGIRVDTIKDVATKRPGSEQVSMMDFDPMWPSLILSLPQVYPHTNETRTEVLWRTLCGDMTSQDDIEASRRNHAKTTESSSAEPLSMGSKAPAKYAAQFRTQLYATILSHAEKQADYHIKLRSSRAGVLLQALMSVQLAKEENSSEPTVRTIKKPSEEELAEIRDTTLEGPYFSDHASKQAIEGFELLYQTDSRQFGGPGCSTPSRAGIAAFLCNPTYRIWYPNANDPGGEVGITSAPRRYAQDAQMSDTLPPDQDGFRTQFARLNGGRRLFVTEKHKYLGLGGMSMQPGDKVWVVKGSKVPFLLRKVGEEDIDEVDSGVEATTVSEEDNDKGKGKPKTHIRSYYKLIGDLYVHGIMNGEAVAGKDEWEDIALL